MSLLLHLSSNAMWRVDWHCWQKSVPALLSQMALCPFTGHSEHQASKRTKAKVPKLLCLTYYLAYPSALILTFILGLNY